MESLGFSDMLTGLPSDLATSILLTWLNVKHVVAVDSAYSNKEKRPHLISLLSTEQLILPKIDLKKDQKSGYLQWLCKRGVRVAHLEVSEDVKTNFVEYVQKLRGDVKQITFDEVNFVTDAENSQNCVAVLNACSSLVALKVNKCVLSRAVIEAILQCTTLRDLRVSCCPILTTAHEEFSLDLLPPVAEMNLHTLEIHGNNFFSPAFWELVAPDALRVLSVCLTTTFTSTNIAPKLASCCHLNALRVSRAYGVVDSPEEQFAELIRLCPQIEHFDLDTHSLDFDNDLPTVIAETLTNLKTLCLCECTFAEAVLEKFVERDNEQLEAVYLEGGGDPELTVETFTALLTNCPNIRTLYYYNCDMDVFEAMDPELLANLTTLRVMVRFEGFSVDCPNLVNYSLFYSPHSQIDYEGEDIYNLPKLKVWEISAYHRLDLAEMKEYNPDVEIRAHNADLTYDFCDVALGISK